MKKRQKSKKSLASVHQRSDTAKKTSSGVMPLLSTLKRKIPQGVFNVQQARKHKISPQLLSHYVKEHKLTRLSQGVYAFNDSLSFDFHSILKEKLACVPQAVIGLESALKVYGLTDETVPAVHLIVPVSNVPKRKLQDVQLYQMKDSLYKKHINIINRLPVSSIERTVVDLLRFGYSLSFVLSVLKECQKQRVPFNIGKIKRIAVPYRVKEKVKNLLEAL